ncbi:MAG: EAL domain-containing protein [Gammaproteobacteria bacterium]|nr:EAL domain-containing protein [Gammaproteobacteria bacterium]
MFKSFQAKLTAGLIGLVAASLVVSFVAVSLATRANVAATTANELRTAAGVFEQLLAVRGNQLRNSVAVLADDFGFREAVASADAATIRSALLNTSSRIEADTGLVLTTSGDIRASIDTGLAEGIAFPHADLLDRAAEEGSAAAIVTLDGDSYQLVVAPVRAPLRIGWIALGFRLDDELLGSLATLTGAEISIASEQEIIGSSLDRMTRAALAERLVGGLDADTGVRNLQLDTAEFLTLQVMLDQVAGPELHAILQLSLTAALASYRELEIQLLAIAGFALFLALLVALFIASGVTQPVRELVARAQKIARGDYSVSLSLNRNDEIGQLNEAFNAMQEGIAEREERIVFQAHHDDLTRLPNRVLAQDRLRQAITRAERTGRPAALVMLDLDRFKEINDALGHQLGDEVLQAVSDRLLDAVRGVDTVARLGGDEFMVVLEDVEPEAAMAKAEDVVEALRRPMLIGESNLHVIASAGVVLIPDHGRDPEQLMRRADIAMYDAKQSHNATLLYRSGRDESHLMRLRLIGDLRVAATRGQFRMFYQPKLDLRRNEITQAEALIRWDHPEHGFMPPDQFITLAEQSGNIGVVTNWVLRAALQQLRHWLDDGLDLSVSINISAMDLEDASLPERVTELLQEFDVSAERLVLEVTESAVMRDAESAIRMLDKLNAAGIQLSIDDFGTGYSSLAQLKRLPVHELKIDKSFVMQLDADSEDAIIVRSTIELAHNMGLSVIAEGVENEAARQLLSDYGCDHAQGYLIAKPLPAQKFAEWLHDSTYQVAMRKEAE